MEEFEKLKLLLAHMSRDKLNGLKLVKQPPVESEADHFYVCRDCGQAVDCRRLGDVLYHDEPDHQPLPVH